MGIDYALLILTRFRGALADGLDVRDGIVEAVTTAGRSVLIAGGTVVISLLGLFLMGVSYMNGRRGGGDHRGAGRDGGVGDAAAVAAGVRRPPGRPPAHPRPGPDAADRPPGAGRALGAGRAAPPLGGGDRRPRRCSWRWPRPPSGCGSGSPTRATARPTPPPAQAYDLISEGFGPGANGPLLVTADLSRPGSAAGLGELERRLRAEDGVAFVAPPRLSPAGDAAILTVIPETAPQDAATQDLVDRLRGRPAHRVGDRRSGCWSAAPPRPSLTRASWSPTGCRSSSPASSGCRSCSCWSPSGRR